MNVNLENALYDSRRLVIDQAVDAVISNPELLKQAVDLAISNKPQIANRASRVVAFICEKQPWLIEPYLHQIIYNLEHITIEVVKGTLMKHFACGYLPKDEEELGILANVCYEHIQKTTQVATTKLYSMEILYKMSHQIPELKPELISMIEMQIPTSLISFKTRARKILQNLYKECR